MFRVFGGCVPFGQPTLNRNRPASCTNIWKTWILQFEKKEKKEKQIRKQKKSRRKIRKEKKSVFFFKQIKRGKRFLLQLKYLFPLEGAALIDLRLEPRWHGAFRLMSSDHLTLLASTSLNTQEESQAPSRTSRHRLQLIISRKVPVQKAFLTGCFLLSWRGGWMAPTVSGTLSRHLPTFLPDVWFAALKEKETEFLGLSLFARWERSPWGHTAVHCSNGQGQGGCCRATAWLHCWTGQCTLAYSIPAHVFK